MTGEEIIRLLREAIGLAGDGGPQPFTEEEYNEMYNFLNKLEKLFENNNVNGYFQI